jgi:hypothetical protein
MSAQLPFRLPKFPAVLHLNQVTDIYWRRSVKMGELTVIAVTHSTLFTVTCRFLSTTTRTSLHAHLDRFLLLRDQRSVERSHRIILCVTHHNARFVAGSWMIANAEGKRKPYTHSVGYVRFAIIIYRLRVLSTPCFRMRQSSISRKNTNRCGR